MVYFWIIIGVSILEPINELRNGRLRNKINAILERLRQIRQQLPAQQQSLPQIQPVQRQLRRSERIRKAVNRLDL